MNSNRVLSGVVGFLFVAASGLAYPQQPRPQPQPPAVPGGTRSPGGPPPASGASLRVERDLEYARVGARVLHLDLYLRDTKNKAPLPVVVWVHGRESMGGDESPSPAARLVAAGYAVASVEYRSPGEAPFPAQLYDLKATVRWLRANGAKYNLDTAHIGAWGNSVGGELVSLLGTTGDIHTLEGLEGNLDQSSRVQAVVDFFGPTDLTRLNGAAGNAKAVPTDSREAMLVTSTDTDQSKDASPINYITNDDAPFLIVHGTADKIVPPRQSEFFQVALKHAGVENDLEYVPGAGHDINQVETPAVAEMVTAFFDKHLRGGAHQRDDIATISEPADAWVDTFPDQLLGTQFKLYETPTRGPHTQASYRIYFPPDYDEPRNAKRRYPVIYYLHGFGDDSRKAINAGYISRLDVAERNGLMPSAIVVVVQALNRAGYVDSLDGKEPVESVIIKDLIPHIDKTYRTAATRQGRAIEGHSMGGAGALHLAFKYPELFTSVASFSAALHPAAITDPAVNAQLVSARFGGDVARSESEGAWSLAVKNADRIRDKMSIRMICGDKDDLMIPNRWVSDVLDKNNIPHQFIVSHGAPHSVKEVIARLEDNPFAYYALVFTHFK